LPLFGATTPQPFEELGVAATVAIKNATATILVIELLKDQANKQSERLDLERAKFQISRTYE